MNEVVEVVADWLIIAYAVFILFFALVIVGVELLKERKPKNEPQSACSEDGARKENAIREVIHRLDNELKYGSIDEALSDTLETCVVRLKSTLPGEEAR